jgi:hypothetical protein
MSNIWTDRPCAPRRACFKKIAVLLVLATSVAGGAFANTPPLVIGDLGGLPVAVPSNLVRDVEYDGDPRPGEQRAGPVPQRTRQSGLRNLAFEVRYPDFVLVSSEDDMQAGKRKPGAQGTPLLSVSVIANSYFGDGRLLERSVANLNSDPTVQYERRAAKEHGLDAYGPVVPDIFRREYDPASRAHRSDLTGRDIFVHYDKYKKVDAVIRCDNRNHAAASCQHIFNLASKAKAQVSVNYRRSMLPQWRSIQDSLKFMIFGLRQS